MKDKLVNAAGCFAVALMALVGASSTAMAQSTDAPTSGPRWTVNCGSDPQLERLLCLLAQEIRVQQTGQRLVRMQINLAGEQQTPFLTLSLPHGVLFQQGVVLQIDDGDAQTLAIGSGDNQGSYVTQSMDDALIDALRRGSILSLTLTTLNEQQLKVEMSLDGFSRAMDMVLAGAKV